MASGWQGGRQGAGRQTVDLEQVRALQRLEPEEVVRVVAVVDDRRVQLVLMEGGEGVRPRKGRGGEGPRPRTLQEAYA
jgi:hypothetical protein